MNYDERLVRWQSLRQKAGYPDVPVPNPRTWALVGPEYQPVEFLHPKRADLADWKNPEYTRAAWHNIRRYSRVAVSSDPTTGRPRNPTGATGIVGPGRLGCPVGPNFATSAALLLDTAPTSGPDPRKIETPIRDRYQLLVGERQQDGLTAIPGGFCDRLPDGSLEDPLQAALRELLEETAVALDSEGWTLLRAGVPPMSLRNTDSAWVENQTFIRVITADDAYELGVEPAFCEELRAPSFRPLSQISAAAMSDWDGETLQLIVDGLTRAKGVSKYTFTPADAGRPL